MERGGGPMPEVSRVDVKGGGTEPGEIVTGFSPGNLPYLLGGCFRASLRLLNDNIVNGRIRGLAGVVGLHSGPMPLGDLFLSLLKELIKNDILVLLTAPRLLTLAVSDLLVPEASGRWAGAGLAEFDEAVGLPPVLHMGDGPDHNRILLTAAVVVREGGLGRDLPAMPVAGAVAGGTPGEALAVGRTFVSTGVFTVFPFSPPESAEGTGRISAETENPGDPEWVFCPDPKEAALRMIRHIDQKRNALNLEKRRERVLYDMAMRRDLKGA